MNVLSIRFLLLLAIMVTAFQTFTACNRNQPSTGPQVVESTPDTGPIKWRYFSTKLNPVKALAIDKSDLWMGTSQGLIRFNTRSGEFETYTPASTEGGLSAAEFIPL